MCIHRRPITGKGDYIIGTDCRDFYNVFIKELRVSEDHQIIPKELKGWGERINRKYCNCRTTWTIAAPKRGKIQE